MRLNQSALLLVLLLHVASFGVHVKGDHINGKTNAGKPGAKIGEPPKGMADASVKIAEHNADVALRALEAAQVEKIAKDKAVEDAANGLETAKANEKAEEAAVKAAEHNADVALRALEAAQVEKEAKERDAEVAKNNAASDQAVLAAKQRTARAAEELEAAVANVKAAEEVYKNANEKAAAASKALEAAMIERDAQKKAHDVDVNAWFVAQKSGKDFDAMDRKATKSYYALIAADARKRAARNAKYDALEKAEEASRDLESAKSRKEDADFEVTLAAENPKVQKAERIAKERAAEALEASNALETAKQAHKGAKSKATTASQLLVAARAKRAEKERALEDAKNTAQAAKEAIIVALGAKEATERALKAVKDNVAKSVTDANDKKASSPVTTTDRGTGKNLNAPKTDALTNKGGRPATVGRVPPKVSVTVPPMPDVNKTTILSATAISSTIPAVLITSVVFLYLYNW